MTCRKASLGVGLLAFLVGCGGASAELAPVEAPEVPLAPEVRVEVATVQPSAAWLELNIPGEVEGSRDALLASPMGGYVESVAVDEGQDVRKGTSLVRVNSSVYAAQRDQAEAQRDLAASELERVKALGDLASAAQIQGAETQARVTAAAATLAGINLSRSLVTAPFDGVVAQLAVEAGEVTSPNAPIARVVQLDPVTVNLSVTDRDVVHLRPGTAAEISVDSQGTPYQGTITTVSPAADLRTRSFVAEVSVPNPDRRLLPGMIATAHIAEQVASDAIVIPQDWLVTSLEGIGVFVNRGGVAEWRPVKVSALVRDQAVIEEGLVAGDQVVSNGHRELAPGDRLLLSRSGVCCTSGRVTY